MSESIISKRRRHDSLKFLKSLLFKEQTLTGTVMQYAEVIETPVTACCYLKNDWSHEQLQNLNNGNWLSNVHNYILLHTANIPVQMKNTFMIIESINSSKIILHAENYREVSTALLQQTHTHSKSNRSYIYFSIHWI